MVSFENPKYIIFFVLVLLALLIYFSYKKWIQRTLHLLASPENRQKQLVGFSFKNIRFRFVLLLSALFLMTVALMNVRRGSGQEISDRKGLDIVFALDVSKSMLATDMQPNRLEKSKVLIQHILKQLQGDRAGLVIFAGKAYLQSPITSDYNAIHMMLETVSPDAVPSPGTVLAEAIDMSRKSFNQETNQYKVLVLISDGEDHDTEALASAAQAKKEGVVIYTIGVGSPEGAYLMDPQTNTPRKDHEGNEIITKLNEAELQALVKKGDGLYFLLNNPSKVAEAITNDINKLEKRNQGVVVFTQYKSYFQWFLGLALIALLVEGLWDGRLRKNKQL